MNGHLLVQPLKWPLPIEVQSPSLIEATEEMDTEQFEPRKSHKQHEVSSPSRSKAEAGSIHIHDQDDADLQDRWHMHRAPTS